MGHIEEHLIINKVSLMISEFQGTGKGILKRWYLSPTEVT